MKAIKIPAQLVGATPLNDGGMSLRFHTQEATISNKVVMMEFFQKMGWLVFKEDEVVDEEVPTELSGYEEGKTPSVRLRNVIYIFWEQNKQDEYPDFESFYRLQMNKIIETFKTKLI